MDLFGEDDPAELLKARKNQQSNFPQQHSGQQQGYVQQQGHHVHAGPRGYPPSSRYAPSQPMSHYGGQVPTGPRQPYPYPRGPHGQTHVGRSSSVQQQRPMGPGHPARTQPVMPQSSQQPSVPPGHQHHHNINRGPSNSPAGVHSRPNMVPPRGPYPAPSQPSRYNSSQSGGYRGPPRGPLPMQQQTHNSNASAPNQNARSRYVLMQGRIFWHFFRHFVQRSKPNVAERLKVFTNEMFQNADTPEKKNALIDKFEQILGQELFQRLYQTFDKICAQHYCLIVKQRNEPLYRKAIEPLKAKLAKNPKLLSLPIVEHFVRQKSSADGSFLKSVSERLWDLIKEKLQKLRPQGAQPQPASQPASASATRANAPNGQAMPSQQPSQLATVAPKHADTSSMSSVTSAGRGAGRGRGRGRGKSNVEKAGRGRGRGRGKDGAAVKKPMKKVMSEEEKQKEKNRKKEEKLKAKKEKEEKKEQEKLKKKQEKELAKKKKDEEKRKKREEEIRAKQKPKERPPISRQNSLKRQQSLIKFDSLPKVSDMACPLVPERVRMSILKGMKSCESNSGATHPGAIGDKVVEANLSDPKDQCVAYLSASLNKFLLDTMTELIGMRRHRVEGARKRKLALLQEVQTDTADSDTDPVNSLEGKPNPRKRACLQDLAEAYRRRTELRSSLRTSEHKMDLLFKAMNDKQKEGAAASKAKSTGAPGRAPKKSDTAEEGKKIYTEWIRQKNQDNAGYLEKQAAEAKRQLLDKFHQTDRAKQINMEPRVRDGGAAEEIQEIIDALKPVSRDKQIQVVAADMRSVISSDRAHSSSIIQKLLTTGESDELLAGLRDKEVIAA